MTIAFISDLHLADTNPLETGIFLRFLNEATTSYKALYILGDFFDAWIGDDDDTTYNKSIIKALQNATSNGLAIFIMHGNRDFLLGKKFLNQTGCTLLNEKFVLNINGNPTLLMHGDTLCTLDHKYLKFRKKARCWLVQKLFLFKSLKKRRDLAKLYRSKSQAHVSTLSESIMDVTQAEVEKIMQKHKVQHLIHGHTHRQAIHGFTIEHKPVTRTVLGAWHGEGNALICEENGTQKFITVK